MLERGSTEESVWLFARHTFRIVWMKQRLQISALPLLKRETVIIEPGLVVIETAAIRPEFGDVQRREVQDLAKLPFAALEPRPGEVQLHADPGEEFSGGKRFDQVVIRACRQPFHL